MRYDTYQIKKIRALDSYKALVSKVRGMIANVLRKEQSEAAADKYISDCKAFDDEHSRPQTPNRAEPRPRPVHVYDSTGELVMVGSAYAVTKYLTGKRSGINQSAIEQEKIYKGYLVSHRMMTQEQAREVYQDAEQVRTYNKVNTKHKMKRGKR